MTKDLHKQMADFWADFLPENRRSAFCDSLVRQLDSTKDQRDKILYCDYDPDKMLLTALREAGIECRGCLFSGDDIGFPRKTGTMIHDGNMLVKQGYGVEWLPAKQAEATA